MSSMGALPPAPRGRRGPQGRSVCVALALALRSGLRARPTRAAETLEVLAVAAALAAEKVRR